MEILNKKVLKFKADKNMEELKKYGFKKYEDAYSKDENRDITIYICNKTRVVEVSVEMTGAVPSIEYEFPTTIYDLIHDGYVEKCINFNIKVMEDVDLEEYGFTKIKSWSYVREFENAKIIVDYNKLYCEYTGKEIKENKEKVCGISEK